MLFYKKLRVLMYHKVSEHQTDDLTVTVEQLRSHILYLQSAGYQIISIKELLFLLQNKQEISSKTVIITFDDGYLNNLTLAYPILQALRAKATIFLPTAFIGKTNAWDNGNEPLLTVAQLKSIDNDLIEWGLHSNNHQNFKHLTLAQITDDITQNIQFFQENDVPFVPALAYPYGGRPQDKQLLKAMKQALTQTGISLAFRIGNRHNHLPINDLFEIERLDIQGTDSFSAFVKKVKWGKWLF